MWSYFSNLSPVIMAVVGILVFFSLGSWAIMAWKFFQIGFACRGSREFLDYFWETKDFAAVERELARFEGSPVALVFQEGYRETRRFLEAHDGCGDEPKGSTGFGEPAGAQGSSPGRNPGLGAGISGIDNVSRSLRKAVGSQEEKLERNLSFLATTASVTPFIGLFGTVWGIMIAFRNIGQTGSTSLDVVAPGISEALVTTAIGLAVAIPAVVGFNYFQGKIKAVVGEIEGFYYDFLNIVQRIIASERQ
jgi:biopolymer transport protein TolQ